MEITEGHPESVDPSWFQALVGRAFNRELNRLMQEGVLEENAVEEAMWYVFKLRNSLTDLYQAGAANEEP
jgi:hypothetical protein